MESAYYYTLTHPHPLIFKKGSNKWFCDVSVQLNGCMSGQTPSNHSEADHYVCSCSPTCIYAVCLACYNHYKCTKNEMPDFKAPFRSTLHPHVLLKNVGKEWHCDGKKFYVNYNMHHEDGKNKNRYSCRPCDFDLCPKCMDCSLDIRTHVNRVLLARQPQNANPMKNLLASKTFQILEEESRDNVADLKEKIRCLEVENAELKEELGSIKDLISEIQVELKDFKQELDSGLRDLLVKHAGSALGVFDMIGGTVSSLSDILTIIPGVGQIIGALKLMYSTATSTMSAVKNKGKADRIKKTLHKLEDLSKKLNRIC